MSHQAVYRSLQCPFHLLLLNCRINLRFVDDFGNYQRCLPFARHYLALVELATVATAEQSRFVAQAVDSRLCAAGLVLTVKQSALFGLWNLQ